MIRSTAEDGAQFYVDTYDESVPDWPDEIEFYRGLSAEAKSAGGAVLELACGTGRVAIRLANDGADVLGLDLSNRMIEVGRRKSAGMKNMRWVLGDMRAFRLSEVFALVIIPGHAFQNLNSPEDQVACLASARQHLAVGGRLVVHLDHQDFRWLGGLFGEKRGLFEAAGQFTHPSTGHPIQTSRAWSYEPSTQTAICQTRWEELDAVGEVTNRWETGPTRLHCVFRFEMEHLLRRTGFLIEAVYGDFARHPLQDNSSEMIWIARVAPEGC